MESIRPRQNRIYHNANGKRPWELYKKTFFDQLAQFQPSFPGKKKKFRFKNKLFSLDASVIDLCLTMFDWAKFRQTKGAIKLHMLMDHDGYLPTFVHVTDGKTHEVNVAREVKLAPESIVAMDRGYNDYSLFGRWTLNLIWFVTRMKSNVPYTVIEQLPVPKNRNILSNDLCVHILFPQSAGG